MKKPHIMTSKRKALRLFTALTLLLAVLLSGCEKKPAPVLPPEVSTSAAPQKRIYSVIESAIECVRENPVSGTSSKVSYSYEKSNAFYYTLSEKQKALYDEMLPKAKDMTPFEYTAKNDGYDVLDNVLIASAALCRDYPDVDNYFYIKEIFDGDMTTALQASYFLPYDPEAAPSSDVNKIKNEIDIFEEECDLIVSAIPEDFGTYDKYRYLAAIISLTTSYDNASSGAKSSATAYGAIECGLSICQGYASCFEYLCQKADLWCKQVTGVSQDTAHVWNLVKLESGTYHVDVTWADDDKNTPLDSGWQSYFMLTQDEILTDHEIDDGTVATGERIF